MPLDTPEEKKNAWKWVLKQIKLYAVSVLAGLGTVWAVAETYLEDYVDSRIEAHDVEEQKKNKPLREIIGETNHIPHDIVPYYMSGQLAKVDSIEKSILEFQEQYLPYLEYQLKITPMYRFIDESGIEYWMGPDGRPHGVLYDDGEAWCVYSNRKTVIGKSY